jgi:hypothetical protein
MIPWAWISLILLFLPCIILFIYFWPFAERFAKVPALSIWGYYVGRRQRKSIQSLYYRESLESITEQRVKEIEKRIVDALKAEQKHIQEVYARKLHRISDSLANIEHKIEYIKNTYSKYREKLDSSFLSKTRASLREKCNYETGKNLLLLAIITVIYIIDALIARHMLISLNMFVNEKAFQGLPFLEKFSLDIPTIYGLFFTFVFALAFHVLVKRKTIREILEKHYIGLSLAAGFLFIGTALRFSTTTSSKDPAKILMEALLSLCWYLGVIIIYWLTEIILRDNEEYDALFIAIASPILLCVFVVFSAALSGAIALGIIVKLLAQSVISIFKFRINRVRNNIENYDVIITSSIYRGYTL